MMWRKAAVKGVLGQAEPGVYELGGPEVKTFHALMQQMLDVIHRRRVIIGMPFFAARIMAGALDIREIRQFPAVFKQHPDTRSAKKPAP